MNIKTIVAIVVLAAILAGGGFLMWQNSKAAVKDLNATLPEGVHVVKSLFGNEYKVVNKIDGYEFKVPREWKGLENVEYFPETTEGKYKVVSLNITGLEGLGKFIAVDKFLSEDEVNLTKAVDEILQDNGLASELLKGKIGNFETIKTQGIQGLGGLNITFFKANDSIYAVTWGSEEFSEKVILTGRW